MGDAWDVSGVGSQFGTCGQGWGGGVEGVVGVDHVVPNLLSG